jgi:16S rRNA (uracil1498-N3)-methyltransferase
VDGRGTLCTARIERPDPRGCVLRIEDETRGFGARPCRLTMGVAPTKNGDRFEWFLEKATEVGIDAIVPLECANSERRVFRPDRAEKVLVSAMKQSLKAYLPVLAPLTPFRDVATRPFEGTKLIAHCRGGGDGRGGFGHAERLPITQVLPAATDTVILIGPEGDFTEEEVALAMQNGFTPVTLGESRLRTETAALTAVIAAYLKNSWATIWK